MSAPAASTANLTTAVGDVPLYECRLNVGGSELAVLHTGAIVTLAEELDYLGGPADLLPYGVILWPASIALAHEVVTRAGDFRGKDVLELGAGTGLPGVVAASLGARVVQTDRNEAALAVCRVNGERNGAKVAACRLADWTAWDDAGTYHWIIGSDIAYREELHPHLRHIFAANLATGGRVLLADPLRAPSLRLLEGMEADGWKVRLTKWTIGEGAEARTVGVFELTSPREGGD
jgi:predicted nicotinamide N-methyase